MNKGVRVWSTMKLSPATDALKRHQQINLPSYPESFGYTSHEVIENDLSLLFPTIAWPELPDSEDSQALQVPSVDDQNLARKLVGNKKHQMVRSKSLHKNLSCLDGSPVPS